jgi:hypothetical protein
MLQLCLYAGTLAEVVFDLVESLHQFAGCSDGPQLGAFAYRHPGVLCTGHCFGDRSDDSLHGALQVRLRLQRPGHLAEDLSQIPAGRTLWF